VAWPERARYENGLSLVSGKNVETGRADGNEAPRFTQLAIARAHQWLYLGKPEKTWEILYWLFAQQASPGMYTWWENRQDDSGFHLWKNYRGWVKPPHVTPDYWSAAEMALLQLDMLAYVKEEGAKPTLVIGGGVPTTWLSKPMSVQGVVTRLGTVNWNWDGQRLSFSVSGAHRAFDTQPGPNFPAGSLQKVAAIAAVP
jgi:hypothetical protein